ncbi:asparaginase domain-containing protein [Leifsonia sp. F6_8S_P_1B]|uniref:Asparaginase domain-containing protein n=1 Tax=Leifsonia williamsii TaxID=3035919 RepID=A0ABT8K9Q2_9MICO|nr:asparaginase domain-containing protein [Leifsonia williamsii]MDN4613546.1 asparaginase domain-containing protein [Leifsonia williamsii]
MTAAIPSAAIPPAAPMPGTRRARIAVFSGPTATIQNSEPLVTSNAARRKHGLPLLTSSDGEPLRRDIVRMQRLAAPVTVYVEAFSAHPLEADAAELYAAPDGWIGTDGEFRPERSGDGDTPVYEVTIGPEDGLFSLPYMARTRDGLAWDGDGMEALGPGERTRQTFYPDASRIFEEIDRFGLDADGVNNMLSSRGDFTFHRAAPSGGYLSGLPGDRRSDHGEGDIPPETRGEHFFSYSPPHLAHGPAKQTLARLTNVVQTTLDGGGYDGAIWLEGSPAVEETGYWLGLLIDTTVPISCNSAQRPHGALSADGDRNLVDSVDYIRSRIWADADGVDRVGSVLVIDEQIFTARDAQKADARPGGYVATGGHGGVIGTIGAPGDPMLTFWPAKAHTHLSEVNTRRLPAAVTGVTRVDGAVTTVEVPVKDASGALLEDAMPTVTIVKYARYGMDDFSDAAALQVEVTARIERSLQASPLSGFVLEGNAPFGRGDESQMAALRRAVAHGIPVVRTSRGNAEGMVPRVPGDVFVAGSTLTSTKARLLLMACLLRFGALPPAADPEHPTAEEWDAIREHVARYQAVFDTH